MVYHFHVNNAVLFAGLDILWEIILLVLIKTIDFDEQYILFFLDKNNFYTAQYKHKTNLMDKLKGVPKKLRVTATIRSSNSQFIFGTPIYHHETFCEIDNNNNKMDLL